MVGSKGLCLFRAWSTGTTEKPAHSAETAQSSKVIGLITESESDDAVGKGNDTGCEGTSEESMKSLVTGTFDEVQNFPSPSWEGCGINGAGCSSFGKVLQGKAFS
jgi:hypothetical protein